MPLDPDVSRLVKVLGLAPRVRRDQIEERRVAFRRLMHLAETGSHVAASENRVIPGPGGALAIRLYTPLCDTPPAWPAVVYLHGGGFVCGDLDTHDGLCRTLADATCCRLVAVDYRLAPEHPYPAATDDARAATLWVIDQAEALGIDPARIAIAGDSAGATLAAVVSQRVARERPGALALQLLLCPILDWAVTERPDAAGPGLLNPGDLVHERECYVPAGQDPAHPHVSPLRAVDLSDQPPTQIHTAEYDPAQHDGCVYAERLRAAGVPVQHTRHVGMVHLFYGLGRALPYARTALREIGAGVRSGLA